MNRRRRLVVYLVVIVATALGVAAWRLGPELVRRLTAPRPHPRFVALPYVQLGDSPSEGLEILWLGKDRDATWAVDTRTESATGWTAAAPPTMRRIAVEGSELHRVYRAKLSALATGAGFTYRVKADGAVVFESKARARKPPGRPHRFVAFGDCAAGTSAQRAVAHQAWVAQPDYVFITGDIAYYSGRVDDYLDHYFPVYNSSVSSRLAGAPLSRSVPFLAAPGNHDMIFRDLDKDPGALAYFLYWSQPLNGPAADSTSPNQPNVTGSEARKRAFLEAAGPCYPRMANFSFDYAGAHWTVVDTNQYVDLKSPSLRDWIRRDLVAAQNADWRFVAFHQPPFHSSKAHADEQQSRLLVDLFEEGKVDMVLSGHVHNYQRTRPLKFVAGSKETDAQGRVPGKLTIDREYDGKTRTRPEGIVYLVTGAGGARLYGAGGEFAQDFTAKIVDDGHSLTVVDVEQGKLTVRQVSSEGVELDQFIITR